MKELLTTFTDYNIWANRRICEMAVRDNGRLLDIPVQHSFPSIRRTLYHIWDAQIIWLSRMQGVSPVEWPSTEYEKQFAGFDLYFIQQSEDFASFVRTRSEAFFHTPCFYRTMRGKECSETHGGIIMHCMNHSTYHRGQVVALLRSLGEDTLQSTDMIEYLRLRQGR